MLLRINQIICTGKIKYKGNITLHEKEINLFSNKIKIRGTHFNAHICKNIQKIFRYNIHKLMIKALKSQLKIEVKLLEIRVANIHQKTKLPYNQQSLISEFLPKLNSKFNINDIKITQEANIPLKSHLKTILENPNLNYISLTIKVLHGKATINLQLDKAKTNTHVTVISSDFSKEMKNLIYFLEQENGE